MFMRNRLAKKMAAEMREATCAGTQTSKAPTLTGPSVTNHYSVTKRQSSIYLSLRHILSLSFAEVSRIPRNSFKFSAARETPEGNGKKYCIRPIIRHG